MRHGIGGRSAISRGLAVPLAMVLVAGCPALAACGESTSHDVSIDDPGTAALAAQVGSLDDMGWQLELVATQATAVQEVIVSLAKSNRVAVDAWKEEWAALQSAHAAAVAEVEYHNATVAQPEMKAFVLDWDPVTMTMSGSEVVKEEAVPAKPLPAAPQPPPAVSVDLGPVLSQLDGLEALLGRLEAKLRRSEAKLRRSEADLAPGAEPGAMPATSLTFLAVTDVARLLAVANAQAALATAADRLEQVLADVRAALDKGITSDPQMGDVCARALTQLEFSAARAIEDAQVALRVAGAESGVAGAGLPWASSLPAD